MAYYLQQTLCLRYGPWQEHKQVILLWLNILLADKEN